MADIDTLVARHGEENVKKAFWLQQKIKREGLDGIGYMEDAKDRVRQMGPLLIKKAIEDEFSTEV